MVYKTKTMKNLAKNLKEFEKLINRYETITMSEVKECEKNHCSSFYGKIIANDLTGYGSINSCSLCRIANYDCKECVYVTEAGHRCHNDLNAKTYAAIGRAKTPIQLCNAFRERAKFMKRILTLSEIKHLDRCVWVNGEKYVLASDNVQEEKTEADYKMKNYIKKRIKNQLRIHWHWLSKSKYQSVTKFIIATIERAENNEKTN